MKIPFAKPAKAPNRMPERPSPSGLKSVTVGALYRGARQGGDYYDYITTGSRMLLLLLDIAGRRDEAFGIAAEVQQTFRAAADLFGIDDVNEPVALAQLHLEVNRAILAAAGGVRCAPAILASFNEVAGTLWYMNAGHTPPLIKDSNGASVLPNSGVPLGLFSHATQDASICVMDPGSALVMVSRGLVEARAGGVEYGIERVRESLVAAPLGDGPQLCAAVHDAVRTFIESRPRHRLLPGSQRTVGEEDPFSANDATAVALVRHAAQAAAG